MVGYTFILGGARSGKSTYAERLAEHLSGLHSLNVTYVATAQSSDDEMEARILRHREGRPSGWNTDEVPLDVAGWLKAQRTPQVILIDCLSLLMNNWMFLDHSDEHEVFARIDELISAMVEAQNPIVVVSNEVGQGIVPEHPLSRRYRDWLGLMNQKTAQHAEKVIWVIAGIPVDLKSIQVPFL